ncbi:MAG: ATP-NAD kinase family protein [Thermoproteota archaeon]|nr:ATP-NAD kinase family protein [Thermoproteota archaeon]
MGFLVNPIAGMGGRVGLKGTDGVLDEAVKLGAKPVAPKRATEFLTKLKELRLDRVIQILTCPAIMGEEEVKSVGLSTEVLPMRLENETTTAEDTKRAVKLMIKQEVDLIVFVGGDGTARDILDAMQESRKVPVLGVPSGVKMYSGIFAVNPSEAAMVAQAFVENQAQITDFEIMDADETAIRSDRFSISLYGFMKGPFVPLRLQGSKQVSPETLDEHENQMAAAKFVVEEMNPTGTYLLCPGTTVKCVADLLHVDKTLLGVDIYHNGRVVKDANEEKILRWVKNWENTWIVVSPIGRQGMLFGRGNQQVSPKIIKLVGKERIIVLATRNKTRSVEGDVLRVDTGDMEVDSLLRGYIRVVTDYREWKLMRVI